MAVNGVLGPHEIRLGSDYPVQVFTLNGTPTGGTFQVRYKNGLSTSIAYNDSAANFQTAIRALKVNGKAFFPLASVSRSGTTAADFVWTVTLNYGIGAVTSKLEYIGSLTGGTTPYVAVTATEVPLRWKVIGPIAEGSVDAVAGKSFIANSEGVGQERTSQPKISEWVMEDWTAGLTYFDYKESQSAFGFWDSNAMAWVRGQLTCGPQSETVVASATIYSVADKLRFNGIDYFIGYYDSTATNAGHIYRVSSLDAVTTVRTGNGSDRQSYSRLHVYKDYLYVFNDMHGGALPYYMNTSESFTAMSSVPFPTGNPVTAVNWDVGMYAIATNTSGPTLYSTTANPPTVTGDWTSQATIPDGSKVRDMKVWVGPDKQAAIYILTETGLWWFDSNSLRILQVIAGRFGGTTTPYSQVAHKLEIFQGDLYIIGNTTVFKWDGSTLTDIGPATNYGLPLASYKFNIGTDYAIQPQYFIPLNRWLITVCTSNVAARSCILGWNGQAWFPLASPSDINTAPVGTLHYGAAYSEDGARPGIYYINNTPSLQRYTFNDAVSTPINWADQRYRTSSTHITGWFDRGLSEVPKAGYYVRVYARGLSATETIKVYYQIDYAPDSTATNTGSDPRKQWVQMVDASGSALTINAAAVGGSSGVAFAYFDRATLADAVTYYSQGLRHYHIRFRFELAGAGGTVTPIMHSAVFGLDPLFEPLWGWSASLDLGNCPDGRSAEQARFDLREIDQSISLTPFACTNTDVYQVRLDRAGLQIATGANIASGAVGPVATIQVSERVSTR